MGGEEPLVPERRRHPRSRVVLPVQFFTEAGGQPLVAGTTVDVSPGGLLVECPHIGGIAPAQRVTVHVGLPSEAWAGNDGRFEGRVTRVERGAPARAAAEVADGISDILLVPELVGKHPSILAIKKMLAHIVDYDANVLIRGESGTGKSVLAKLIHQYSSRSALPLVRQNCPSIPETLLETQLFGHERGAFTDAKSPSPGLFRLAHGGTIVLEEVSAIHCSVQAKLLQAIEEKRFFPVGGKEEVQVDVRIIATSNDDLEDMISRGHHRSDLFYRLNEIPLFLPALRDRPSDIPLLADYLLRRHCAQFAKHYEPLGKSAIEMLVAYPWPGNVRELENVVKRSILTGQFGIPEADAGNRCDASQASRPRVGAPIRAAERLRTQLADLERVAVVRALETAGGNKTRAAAALGVSYRTLLRKLKRYQTGE
jgi:transcriptional regulator with PAS, ATPase and Fis domain